MAAANRSALPSPAALDRAVTYLATTRTDGELCLNSSSRDDGPDAERCALMQDEHVYPPTHDMHSNADHTHGWGNPPEVLRYRCWRGHCFGRERRFHRVPITNRWGWSWQYEGTCGHWRSS